MNALWAAAYAERLGWRLLPCWTRTKRAILPHTSASNDPLQIQAWAEEYGDRLNWAVATGPGSGIIALDIEDAAGERELARLEMRHGPLPDLYPVVWSGGGQGWHGYLRWPEGAELRNCKIGDNIEIRGDKLLLMLPPSIHPETGKRYRWAADRAPDIGFPDLPDGWIEHLKPEPVPERREFMPAATDGPRIRYVAKALEAELERVALAREGGRNHQLNASAHALFRFAVAGELDPDLARRGLVDAARHAGLAQLEAMATVKSAARARGITL
jgi:hypothetical protein